MIVIYCILYVEIAFGKLERVKHLVFDTIYFQKYLSLFV
jgi:hypothetical protein